MTAPESSPKPAAAAIAEIRQRYADSSKHLVNWWDSDIKVLLLEIQRLEAAAIQRGDGQTDGKNATLAAWLRRYYERGVELGDIPQNLLVNFSAIADALEATTPPAETSGATPRTDAVINASRGERGVYETLDRLTELSCLLEHELQAVTASAPARAGATLTRYTCVMETMPGEPVMRINPNGGWVMYDEAMRELAAVRAAGAEASASGETPDTDGEMFKACPEHGAHVGNQPLPLWVVEADVARRLERQRNEARRNLIVGSSPVLDAIEAVVNWYERDTGSEGLDDLMFDHIYPMQKQLRTAAKSTPGVDIEGAIEMLLRAKRSASLFEHSALCDGALAKLRTAEKLRAKSTPGVDATTNHPVFREVENIMVRLGDISDGAFCDMEGADADEFRQSEALHVECAKAAEVLRELLKEFPEMLRAHQDGTGKAGV